MTDYQSWGIVAVKGLEAFIFLMILIVIIVSTTLYIVPMKVRKPLIIALYCIAFAEAIFILVTSILYAMYPQTYLD